MKLQKFGVGCPLSRTLKSKVMAISQPCRHSKILEFMGFQPLSQMETADSIEKMGLASWLAVQPRLIDGIGLEHYFQSQMKTA